MLELFVTGIDNNSDKVFVTAGLTAVMQSLGYSTGVYKPVEVGAIEKDGFIQSLDFAFIKFIDPFIKTYFTYFFKAKSAPLLAAAAESVSIEKNTILADFQKIQGINEVLIVDGISGLASPLNKNFLVEDMIKMFDLPLLIVVSAKDTKIDNIILSVNHARESGIPIRGIILTNFPENCDDANIKLLPKLIEEYTGVSILGILPVFERNVDPNDLINEVLNGIDIEGVFNVQIPKLRI